MESQNPKTQDNIILNDCIIHLRKNLDLLDVSEGFIFQVCNIAGGYGAGLSGIIAKKYPEVESTYRLLFKSNYLKLGRVSILPIDSSCNTSKKLAIVNLYAMPNYAKSKQDKGKLFLDYEALDKALEEFTDRLDTLYESVPAEYYFPYNMGAGNAGGDWNKILDIISKHFNKITICYPQNEQKNQTKNSNSKQT